MISLQVGPKEAEPTIAREAVVAVAGEGLEGDRYFKQAGVYDTKLGKGKEVTLIEEEVLLSLSREHGFELSFAETRRNVLVRGVALNDLVGREFTVGPVVLRGARLCEPCLKLSERTGKPVLRTLVRRGGLMCSIITGGTIRVGDAVAT